MICPNCFKKFGTEFLCLSCSQHKNNNLISLREFQNLFSNLRRKWSETGNLEAIEGILNQITIESIGYAPAMQICKFLMDINLYQPALPICDEIINRSTMRGENEVFMPMVKINILYKMEKMDEVVETYERHLKNKLLVYDANINLYNAFLYLINTKKGDVKNEYEVKLAEYLVNYFEILYDDIITKDDDNVNLLGDENIIDMYLTLLSKFEMIEFTENQVVILLKIANRLFYHFELLFEKNQYFLDILAVLSYPYNLARYNFCRIVMDIEEYYSLRTLDWIYDFYAGIALLFEFDKKTIVYLNKIPVDKIMIPRAKIAMINELKSFAYFLSEEFEKALQTLYKANTLWESSYFQLRKAFILIFSGDIVGAKDAIQSILHKSKKPSFEKIIPSDVVGIDFKCYYILVNELTRRLFPINKYFENKYPKVKDKELIILLNDFKKYLSNISLL